MKHLKTFQESSLWVADPEDDSWAIFRISHGKGFVTSLNTYDSISTCHYRMKYSDPQVLKFNIEDAKKIIMKNVSFHDKLGIVNKDGIQRIYNMQTKMFDAK